MNWKGSVLACASMIVMALMLSGCSYHYKCNVTFGGPPCSSSGGSSGSGSFTSGGTGSNAGGASDIMYTMPSGGNTTQGFVLQGGVLLQGNNLAALTGVTLPGVPIGFYSDMAIINKQFLYVPGTIQTPGSTTLGAAQVNAYGIDHSTGALTAISGSPFKTSQRLSESIGFDAGGKFLFIGDTTANAGTIAAFAIDSSTGALTEAPGSPLAVPGTPNVLAVDGSGKYLYATFAAAGGIMAFNIDQTSGALSAMAGSPFNVAASNFVDIKTDSSGKFLIGTLDGFNTTGPLNNDQHLYVIPIDQTTGALSTATPFPTANFVFAVTTNPANPYVYGFTEDASGSPTGIEGFSISSSGVLTPIVGSPFTALTGGFFGKFDQNGTQLFYPMPSFKFAVAGADASTGALTQTVGPTLFNTDDVFAVTN